MHKMPNSRSQDMVEMTPPISLEDDLQFVHTLGLKALMKRIVYRLIPDV